MTRRLLIVAVLLIGMIIGYLAGCCSHVHSRTITRDPEPGHHRPVTKQREQTLPLFDHMEDTP